MYHVPWPFNHCIKTWQPDIELDSVPFMYLPFFYRPFIPLCFAFILLCKQFTNCQIIRVVEIPKTEDVKRPYIRQLLVKNLKFPLPHRVPKGVGKKVFAAQRPSTW